MKYIIHAADPLVFRDGRPFGSEGGMHGGILRWPLPSTVAGMFRRSIGLKRDTAYFSRADKQKWQKNVEAIDKVHLRWILPAAYCRKNSNEEGWQYLFPEPADAFVTLANDDSIRVRPYSFMVPEQEEGTDLPWRNWRFPLAPGKEKPLRDAPELWHAEQYLQWLVDEPKIWEILPFDLGLSLPISEFRMHTAIDSLTGTVREGQLFSSQGVRLEVGDKQGRQTRLGIAVCLDDMQAVDDPSGPCHVGGERRTAWIDRLSAALPECPNVFAGRRFLRLVLASPGDFGGWVPSWLGPDPSAAETSWCRVPGSDLEIRLVSAFVSRWQPVSGWDYCTRSPKATRKLVPAGSVYYVEIKDPGRSQEVAELLWGRSLGENLSHKDACGCVFVGIAFNIK